MPKPRLGLCCQFVEAPIKFRTATAARLLKLPERERLAHLSALCLENAASLLKSVEYCGEHGIGAFRISSQILPLKTHPECGYSLDELADYGSLEALFIRAAALSRDLQVRLSFHPDQFVVLNSARPDVVANSIEELDYQCEVAELVGADVVNIHAGAAGKDKASALGRLAERLADLPARIRSRITLENDDRVYTPEDLLPFCEREGVPFVYDVHHHRCTGGQMSIDEVTERAVGTWGREPLFHISSPLEGWEGPKPHRHHDYIQLEDFPECWRARDLTVDVEAKAKELAVAKLRRDLGE